ncbi:MAG: hypothetical protein KOO66_08610 [Bacteroidales bacterium]|nr:hypothetical protein [Bacteroidales bacterium]
MKKYKLITCTISFRFNQGLKFFIFLILLLFTINESICQDLIKRDLLINDVRQLSHILETAHPDPYINGGGKIAFHQRFQSILESIPDSGMSKSDFYKHIIPFVAKTGDSHTILYNAYSYDLEFPGGIPLYFKVIEKSLFVQGIPDEKYKNLIGSVLVSVENITFPELVERQEQLTGCDNEYSAYDLLAGDGSLFFKETLQDLIPEWKETNLIKIKLKLVNSEIIEQSFKLPVKINYPFIKPITSIKLPSTEKCDFAYDFIDKKRDVAILKITSMTGYREDFELSGTSHTMNELHKAWIRFYGTKPLKDDSVIIAGIPSAAELFNSLINDMKNSETKTLIVDVRDNHGGNSLMMDFLWYFLFGKEKYLSLKGETATDITKLSDLYFENRPNANIEDIKNDYNFPINKFDYDFRYNCFQNHEKLKSLNIAEILDYYFSLMPSFNKYYSSDQDVSHYSPAKIIVLCSPGTFSGGYELMWGLHKSGATIAGTPSGQAGNFFSDVLIFNLKNSGLDGQVSSKSQMLFPDDPIKGKILQPDISLTYDYLKANNFDENAVILLTKDKLKLLF